MFTTVASTPAARTSTENDLVPEALSALEAELHGSLTVPGDPGWDEARQAWHLAVDQRPVAVVHAGSVSDIVAVVKAARELGLRVAPQATGHNAAPMGPLDATILLRTSRLRGVHIDPVSGRARVEPGALWMDVTSRASTAGLAGLAGSAPDVGVVGYTLGGGLSWLGRSHGLAANSVLALEVVTADGELHRVDEDNEPDLFWALRGGGGSFGIVTAMEFQLYRIPTVYAGAMFWPIEAAREVLHAWHEWTATVPDSVTSIGRLLRFPPLPQVPEPLRGKDFVVIEATCQLREEDGAALLERLRALGPALDTFARMSTSQLGRLHMDPDGPVPAFGDGMLLKAVTAEAIDAFVDAGRGDEGSALLSAELRHLGGALTPGRTRAGAVDGLDADFALFAVGLTPSEDAGHAVRRGVDAVHLAMTPWCTGGAYLNFAERRKAGRTFFGGAMERLQEVKATYDPHDVVRANHPVSV